MAGRLYLLPVTLGNDDYSRVIPEKVAQLTRDLRYFIVEDLRSARRYLKHLNKDFPIDSCIFFLLNEHTAENEIKDFLKPATDGFDIGLMSEAGLPCIADPGAKIVELAHEMGITVMPQSGPSSIVLALIGSGLAGQNFCFNGYLPVKSQERDSAVREMEKRSRKGFTQIFMETPYRNQHMFDTIISICHDETRLCIATDITLVSESIKTMRISDWKKNKPALKDRLVVFLLG